MKEGYYIIKKTGRGFSNTYLYYNHSVRDTEEVLEEIGEGTDGGENSGYRVDVLEGPFKTIPKKKRWKYELEYKQVTRTILEEKYVG